MPFLYGRVAVADATFVTGRRSHFWPEEGRVARRLAWDVHKLASIDAA
jgi:hypothetical protein